MPKTKSDSPDDITERNAKKVKCPLTQLFDKSTSSKLVKFSNEVQKRDIRLMEISNSFLLDIESEKCLKILGSNQNASAVLCTSKKSYAIKKVETSNSVLLIPPSMSHIFSCEANSQYYYELRETVGNFSAISELLKKSEFSSIEDDLDSRNIVMYTFEELQAIAQVSDYELRQYCSTAGIVEINGKARLLSAVAIFDAKRHTINSIIENGWSMDDVCGDLLTANLPQMNSALLQYTLSTLGQSFQIDGCACNSLSHNHWKFDMKLVTRMTAHSVFLTKANPLKQVWSYEDFVSQWAIFTPESACCKTFQKEWLYGIAIESDEKNIPQLIYAPVESLPSDPKGRFEKLFEIKSNYKIEELMEYFEDFKFDVSGKMIDQQTMNFLSKYTKKIDNYYRHIKM